MSAHGTTIAAAFVSWAAISLGFLGLKMLMQERPEFVGQPIEGTKVEMIQESPRIVARKASDDVSVIKPLQPELSEVRFDMAGRRDYRGLRTIMDMSGQFHGRYVLTNTLEEPMFVLFRCPHPRAKTEGGNVQASALRLHASSGGTQDNIRDTWFWSGTLEAGNSVVIEVSYQVASLRGAAYRVGDMNGNPVKQLRVTFNRQDLDSVRFESGEGPQLGAENTVIWERREFLAPDFFSATIVEGRNLYASMAQLLDIGPLVCLLFLLAISAAILARQALTPLQMFTLAAGYAFYFPLILYLSARLSFPVALIIAAVVPGALLVNYARWLVGSRIGLVGGPVFLALYWVFPTLAAFAGWNRGLVLLCLGVVTLWVLINLQNQALRRKAVTAVFSLSFSCALSASAGEIQLLLPAELTNRPVEPRHENAPAIVAFEPAQYQARAEASHFEVEARVGFQVLRAGEATVPLFNAPIYLIGSQVQFTETNLAGVLTVGNRLVLFVSRTGSGTLKVAYRAPVTIRESKRRTQIPLLAGVPGNCRIESPRGDLEILTGSLWSRSGANPTNLYDIGVAGDEMLTLEWRDATNSAPAAFAKPDEATKESAKQVEVAKEFYGIGLTHARNLTVINSDGSCTHFAELELPAFQFEEFRMRLPPKARLISVSVNGKEIASPAVEDQVCRIRLPAWEAQPKAHRLSFRIGYPPVRLGFIGTVELALPELFQTTGTLEWVVALPNGFQAQVVSSGLEAQNTPADLGPFGDYGRILKSHAHTSLSKDLAPPGPVGLSLKYRQVVPGIFEGRQE